MNALILKEGRLLMRGFLVMAALILGVIWIPPRYEGLLIVTSFILCPAAVLMLAIDSFGREFSSRTFSNLLSLPVSRERVWWVKSLLLAVAMLVLWVVWWKSVLWKFQSQPGFRQSLWLVQWGSLVYLWVAYSGGLWATLLCRQVAAAAWVAILVPFGMALMMTNWQWDLSARVWMWVFSCYGLMGVVAARWLYLRAQDASGVTEELEHVRWDGVRRRFAFLPSGGASSSWMALFWKEIQLHHTYLMVGGVLAAVHVGAVVGRHVLNGWQGNQMLKFVLENAWMLWMVMPWMIGCSTVAEERRMGIWESQLCAPVARWRQILIKVGVGGMLGMLFGGLMPVLIDRPMVMEFMGSGGNGNEPGMFRAFASRLPWIEALSQLLLQWLPVGFDLAPLFQYGCIVVVVVSVSIFASSLSRTTIQALGPSLLGMLLFFLGWTYLRNPEDFRSAAYWAGPIGLVIAVPLMGLVLLGLLYRNALRSESGWALWRMNLRGLGGGLVMTALLSAGMYHRIWERVMTLEPAHTAPLLVRGNVGEPWSGPRIVRAQWGALQVRFPEGRNWSARPYYRSAGWVGMLGGDRDVIAMGPPKIVEGSNWVSVVINRFDTVAVKDDGTLWVSEKPRLYGSVVVRSSAERGPSEEPRLVQYGTENDWKAAMPSFNAVFLLKKDGSLWRFGKDQWEGRGWPGLRAMEITRLGTENDWASMKSLWSQAVIFVKKDGRAFTWNWNMGWVNSEDVVRFDEKTVFQRTPYLDSLDSEYLASVGVEAESLKWFLPTFLVGLGSDGVLKLVAAWDSDARGFPRDVRQRNVEIGAVKDWVGLAASQGRAVTLKSDGTLWLWKFTESPDLDPDSATRTQLGRHSDWVAISEGFGGVLSLAADGSLWLWKFNPGGGFSRGNQWFPLLGASSRPERLAQVLP